MMYKLKVKNCIVYDVLYSFFMEQCVKYKVRDIIYVITLFIDWDDKMGIRDKIKALESVKQAILDKMVPITEELLSRLQAFGVSLDGYSMSLSDTSVSSIQLENLKYDKHTFTESFLSTLVSNLKRYVYKDTNDFIGLNEKIVQNGLYHFTSSADAILESGFISPSSAFASYGNPKTFFFSGIPEAGAVATNLDILPLTITAIKIKPDLEMLHNLRFKVRSLDDGAISYDGKFDLTGIKATKEYFCLMKDKDILVYKPVSEEFYKNYSYTQTGQSILQFLQNKRNIQAIQSDYLYSLFSKNGFAFHTSSFMDENGTLHALQEENQNAKHR